MGKCASGGLRVVTYLGENLGEVKLEWGADATLGIELPTSFTRRVSHLKLTLFLAPTLCTIDSATTQNKSWR
jgi:hypothetical protein